MAFHIGFLSEPGSSIEIGERAKWGLIVIDSFHERFFASLEYWSVADYEDHWKEAVSRIVDSSDVSCLITSMSNPSTANFIVWWPMYRVGDDVFIQNQILLLDNLPSPFDPSEPFAHVPEHKTINEEGEVISEWAVPIHDLRSFLQLESQVPDYTRNDCLRSETS